MEKRLILAIALSVFIIVTFQHLFVKPVPRQEIDAKRAEMARPPVVKEFAPPPSLAKAPPQDEREIKIETDKYILVFSDIGGSLKRIRIKDYKAQDSGEPLDLVNIKDPRQYIFAISDPLTSLPLDSYSYEFNQKGNALTYSLKIGELEVIKQFILHNSNYAIELQIYIKNPSPDPKSLVYRIIGGAGIAEHNPQDMRFIEVVSKIDGKVINFKRPKNGRIVNPGVVSWTCLKNKYFSIILKPFIEAKAQFYNVSEGNSLVTGVEIKEFVLPPNSFVEHKFTLYAGPSQPSIMKQFGHEFEESVSYGFFGPISKALLMVMRAFYWAIHNWGVSIILLSIFLNVVLFPLTMKSFKSMQKMQALHPQMEKLKAQHKDNPQKLNKEIMELYKKYNINPFGGCLPMLLQMPIFMALYNALIRSIELKGVNFLWIKDLSLPDGVKIPFALPLVGDHINILPILMVIAMVVQQKISTKTMGSAVTGEQKQQQQMMLIIMPIMFGFIFYNMPSGLVLYWLVNTILTLVEQSVMFKST